MLHLSDDTVVNSVYNETLNFYHSLWDKMFKDAFPITMANFYSAYDLYDYAAYRYNHDNTSHSQITQVDLAMLAKLAQIQQRDINGNLSVNGLHKGDMIQAIAGRTLAAKILSQFKINIDSEGASDKLTLMFGSFQPFFAFFALSGLINGPSEADFEPLPNPGAAMVFELFSIGGNESVYPDPGNLWVRFLYRNSTIDGTKFINYPLFGNGNSQSYMRYADFVSAMQTIAVDTVPSWCTICDSVTLFCSALLDNSAGSLGGSSGGSIGSSGISPAVAGVVGATVTVAVLGLIVMAAALWGGLRITRPGQADVDQGRTGTLGGFKGAEKMASDTDLAIGGSGARHERSGSWELRGGGAKVVSQPAPSRTRRGAEPEDDEISILNHSPVHPNESI
jgi:hypothetical protein